MRIDRKQKAIVHHSDMVNLELVLRRSENGRSKWALKIAAEARPYS
jgi:hypothetical protein